MARMYRVCATREDQDGLTSRRRLKPRVCSMRVIVDTKGHQGMSKYDLTGVAPQNAETDRRGVSLTHSESRFLEALVDLYDKTGEPGYPDFGDRHAPGSENIDISKREPKSAPPALVRVFDLGKEIGLGGLEVNYLREWILAKGVHWLSAERVGLGEDLQARRVFRNPVVRRIINAAAETGVCMGTVATKEELADWFTQRMRSEMLPESIKDNAADKLARLMGWYPKDSGGGSGNVNVQINCVNPYGKEVEVKSDESN